MRLCPKLSVCSLTLALLLLGPALSFAAKAKTAAPEKPVIDEKTTQIFEKTCNALTKLKGFSFRANVTLDKVYQDGSKIQSSRDMDVTVLRPASFKIITLGDDIQVTSTFDGQTFSIALPDTKIYGQLPAAMDTDALMEMLAAKYSIESPLGDLLSNKPCQNMTATHGFYIGKSRVEGEVCDHLFFQGKDVDWQIWVEDGPASLPRKIVITEKKLRMAPQFTAILSGWQTTEKGPDHFVFATPDGFTRDDGVIVGAKRGK